MVNPRAPLNRLAASVAVTVMVLSLVLSGGGAAAQAPDPQQNRPATLEQLQAVERAVQQNGDVMAYPPSQGSYPVGMPEAPEIAAAASIDAWSGNWAVGALCSGSEQCLVGDFNGDKKDDVAVVHADGSVWVATSKGRGFNAAGQWGGSLCSSGELCKAGDFNADGKDDIVVFNHGPNESAGQVWVALSQGNGFAVRSLWHNSFCIRGQVCEVGNVDGTYGDDIVAFYRGDAPAGRVDVALSNPAGAFGGTQQWISGVWPDQLCVGDQVCRVGDMNGDGKDEVVAFTRTAPNANRVKVALSTGGDFTNIADWAGNFCNDPDTCVIGDFDGDHADDALKFIRSATSGTTYGEVYVSLSNRVNALGDPQRWKQPFCGNNDECSVGDFNGDGRADVIRFVKQSPAEPALTGAAYVALASGSPFGFVPTPAPDGKWLEGFCNNSQVCATGDFNGDGLTDIAYFTRGTTADVYVSINQGGTHFGVPRLWQEYACVGSDICQVGDVDADGRDDLIIFSRVVNGGVYVSKSLGYAFESGQPWLPPGKIFCVSGEVCQVGDFNGDGKADIALFTRSAYGNNSRAGDVEVAINSNGQFIPTGIWNQTFCLGSEDCQVGDFNGDGKDDIVAFVKGTTPVVWVALSNGSQFGDGQKGEVWNPYFCRLNEVCATGDPNGDGKDDILAFVQAGYPVDNPASPGDVYVGISQGSQAAGGFTAQKWQDFFCYIGEVCGLGYFNNDKREDIVAFKHDSTAATVWVALANTGTGYYFADSIPVPAGAKRVYLPFVKGQ